MRRTYKVILWRVRVNIL